jgi:hypothetical protein
VIRTIFVILIVAIAIPTVAQDAPPDAATAAFFIERIEVRNARRVSADVVIAESRLREGQQYTEQQLRDASTRLSRLPFLLSVDFALEKGSERGRHVLVLNIVETKPFFYLLDLRPIFSDDGYPDNAHVDYSGHLGAGDTSGVLGFRWFVGRRGAFHAGVTSQDDNRNYTPDYTAITAGYTQYDILGTRAFATLNLKRPIEGYGKGAVVPELVVGLPLSPNQTLTLEVEEARLDNKATSTAIFFEDGVHQTFVQEVTTESTARTLSARWAYNTTNHPFLPTRGSYLSVTPIYFTGDSHTRDIRIHPVTGEAVQRDDVRHNNTVALEADAAQYWEVTDRDSFSAGVKAGYSRGEYRSTLRFLDEERDDHFGIVYGGWSRSLWPRERQRHGDSRVEVDARYSNRTHPYLDDVDGMQVSASWVRRSSWGTLRLGAGYAW